jgi:hypothetical protein
MTELDDALLGVVRLEKCILLFADHVGATGWNARLQKMLDEIQADLRSST